LTNRFSQLILRPAETEAWDLEEHSMDMISPELTNFEFGLGLYAVPSDFCQK